MKKSWYSCKNVAGHAAEIAIFDEIGLWGITAKQFITDLRAIDAETIKLSISSPGGSVFDALAMNNALRLHAATIDVTVLGVAASAASLVAMAGDTITMPENSFMMVHNPLNFAYGNAADMREMADVLDKIGAGLVATYVARTGQSDEKIRALLDAETWMSAAEAIALGFADAIEPALKVAASFDLDRVPDNVRAMITPAAAADPAPAAAPDPRALAASIIAKAAKAGLGALADAFLLDGTVTDETQADQAIAAAVEITAVCKAGGLPDLAPDLIRARVPVDTVRARMIDARATLDRVSHVATHIPQPKSSAAPTLSVAGIYASRAKQ